MRFPKQNILVENFATKTALPLDEIATMHESVMASLKEELKVPNDVLDSFMIKDQLNPDFWTGDKLNPEVKTKLMQISKNFYKDLELPPNVKIKDVLFVGSLANYNWSKYSDIDLHIVIDFNDFEDDKDFIKKHFDAEKNLWNDKHEIKLFGYPIEIYIQDVKEKLSAAAIYSVANDKWKLMPESTKFKIDKSLITRKINKIFDKIKTIKDNYANDNFKGVIKKVTALKDTIKKMRQSGLESGGEFSTENLVFKVLRRTDLMELLNSYKDKAYDKEMSLDEDIP